MYNIDDKLPSTEKMIIRDKFIELLEQNQFVNITTQGLKVDYELSLEHPLIKEKFPETRPDRGLKKHRKIIRKIETKLAKKLQRRALMDYFKEKGALP